MQKNLLLSIFLFCCIFKLSAQASYKLTVGEQPYQEQMNDTLVFENPWFNSTKKVPLGFEFEYFGKSFDSVTVWNDALYFDYESATEDSAFYFMLPFEAFLSDRSIPGPWTTPQSPITYKTEGIPGDRIFKFQVKNAGFSEGTADDYANFQVWLYEKDQSFEFRYGDIFAPSNAWVDGFNGPVISIVESFAGEVLVLEGEEDTPVLSVLDLSDPTLEANVLEMHPINGRMYRFTLSSSSTSNPQHQQLVKVFPNPFREVVTLSVPEIYLGMPFRISNAAGFEMMNGTLANNTLSTSGWPAGHYTLNISTPQGNTSLILLKK